MTNREWLNSLTDEEFADWATGEDCWNPSERKYEGLYPHRRTIESMYNSSYGGILAWLREPKVYVNDWIRIADKWSEMQNKE